VKSEKLSTVQLTQNGLEWDFQIVSKGSKVFETGVEMDGSVLNLAKSGFSGSYKAE